MAIGLDKTDKPPLRCLLLLHSSLTLLPGQWDHHQSCKYTLGATFVIIFQHFLITHHKSFGHATIAHVNIKHFLWRAIATRVTFYSRPGLNICMPVCWKSRDNVNPFDCLLLSFRMEDVFDEIFKLEAKKTTQDISTKSIKENYDIFLRFFLTNFKEDIAAFF